MSCKKHAAVDFSGSVGVCATCLRECLTSIIEAQTRAQAQAQFHSEQDPIKQPDPNPPPPLVFPRSVSPYVSRRKSAADLPPPSSRFYSTPQVGPTFAVDGGCYRQSKPRFSLLTSLFRSRSDKSWAGTSRVDPEPTPSWISAIFAGKRGRRKPMQCFAAADESATVVQVRSRQWRARGMSPDWSHDESASGSGDSTTPEWKRTPVQATPSRKNRSGGQAVMKNVSGLTFCLSPMVRANPNPQWNPKVMQGGFPNEVGGFTGEIRVAATAKPHLSSAASFSMNRSRKLADFGRVTSNR